MDGHDDPLSLLASDDLDEAAIGWLVHLHSGRANDGDRRAYDSWRCRSPAHERAAAEAERLWAAVGTHQAPARQGFGIRRLALAAAILLAAALGGGIAVDRYWPAGGWAALTADARTAVGERRELRLPDGSRLTLNAGSAVDIDYDARVRRIRLRAGELVAEVAPDPSRPFVVLAAGGAVTALGTVFAVRRDAATVSVTVTVLESTVRVAYPAGIDRDDRQAMYLKSGQRLRYGQYIGLGAPESVDAETVTAWRRGKLIFDGARLADVAAEVNRHRAGRIVIADSSLSDLKVTGVFDLDATDAILDTIAATLPVRITYLPYLAVLH